MSWKAQVVVHPVLTAGGSGWGKPWPQILWDAEEAPGLQRDKKFRFSGALNVALTFIRGGGGLTHPQSSRAPKK